MGKKYIIHVFRIIKEAIKITKICKNIKFKKKILQINKIE